MKGSAFFKSGEIVTIDGGQKRWCVDRIRECTTRDDEVFHMADLSDERGAKMPVRADRLTKVGG